MSNKLGIYRFVFFFAWLFFSPLLLSANAATLIWSGAGIDDLASNPSNWLSGVAPQNGDIIVFDGTALNACSWNLNLTLASVRVESGYSGAIMLQSDLSITGNADLLGGTFILNNHNLFVGLSPGQPTLISTFGRGSFNSEGELNTPSGVTVDNNGNLYVCTVSNSTITKFDKDGNYETRWPISSCFGLEADGNNNIYVASRRNHKINKYDSNGTLLLEWGQRGTGIGEFEFPNDVAINRNLGLVYVADSENLRIQVFDNNGNFHFMWRSEDTGGPPFAGTRGPLGIAIDQDSGEVYVADSDARRIQKFDSSGHFLFTWGTSGKNEGEFRWPRDVEVDNNGLVYVASTDTERIQIFDSTGSFVMAIKGEPGVYIPGCSPHLSHVDCTTLHNEDDGPFHPRGVAVDSLNGFVYGAAAYAQRVDKLNISGDYITSLGGWEKDNGVFNKPLGISIDAARGYLYVADTNNFIIQKFDLNGNYLSSWGYSGRVSSIFDGGDGSFDYPSTIAADDEGNVYVLRNDGYYVGDPLMKRIQKFDQSGNFLLGWNYDDPTNRIHIHNLRGIAYNPLNGYIYVSNARYNTIQCFDTMGTYIFEFGGPGNSDGEFNFPSKIAVDRVTGDIYVIDLGGNSRIQKFSSDGNFITSWGSYGGGDNQFSLDVNSGIYTDQSGHVYIADSFNSRVKVFDATGNFILNINTGGKPTGLVVDSSGYIYVVDNWNNRIYKYSPVFQ